MAEILDFLIEQIQQAVPGDFVTVGAMPTRQGIAIYTAGGTMSQYRVKTAYKTLTCAVNAKYKTQRECINALLEIHSRLTTLAGYTVNEKLQIFSIVTISPGNYSGQEGNEWYLYGSSIEIKYYDKREV